MLRHESKPSNETIVTDVTMNEKKIVKRQIKSCQKWHAVAKEKQTLIKSVTKVVTEIRWS